MSLVHTLSIFCEDIRLEANDQRTIVGSFKDAVSVNAVPGMFPKLCIYTRINVIIDVEIESLKLKLVGPKDQTLASNEVSLELLKENKLDAIKKGHPTYGIISEVKMVSFKIEEAGFFNLFIELNGQEYLSGFLNVLHSPEQ